MDNYSINNIVHYRNIDWKLSNDFFYLTEIPENFEPFIVHPDYYAYGILSKGTMDIEIDDCLQHITSKSFMVYRPEQTVKIVNIESGTKGAFILFTRRFIQDSQSQFDFFFKDSFLNQYFGSHVTVQPKDHRRLSAMFHKIFDILSSIYMERWEISAKNLIKMLINETDLVLKKYRSSLLNFSNREAALINRFKILAREHFITERQVHFYASKLNISYSYFYKMMKKQRQQTPSSYLNDLLLQEAKTLLSHSDDNISEIADKLSFSDVYSFSKFFKTHTKVSPSIFRTAISIG